MTLKHKVYLIQLSSLIWFSAITHSFAQISHVWTKNMGSTGNDYGSGLVLDNNDNIITVGYFSGTVDFNPGSGIFNLTSNGNKDVYIQKLDNNGNFLWAVSFGGTLDEDCFSVDVDAAGNIYLIGNFAGTVDFDPGPSTTTFSTQSANSNPDVFISKFNANGVFQWAKHLDGSVSTLTDFGYAIVVDDAGNSYSTGYFRGTIDINPGSETNLITVNGGTSEDVFLLKLDPNGNFVWGYGLGGPSSDRGFGLHLDQNGDLLAVGYHTMDGDFAPGSQVAILSTGSTTVASNGYVIKLTPNGEYIWGRSFGIPTEYEEIWSVKTDSDNNVYLACRYNGVNDLDPGPGVVVAPAFGGRDVAIIKLNENGDFVWGKAFGGPGWDYCRSIAIDPDNNDVFIAVSQHSTTAVNYANPPINNTVQSVNGEEIVVIARYDSDGNHLCAFGIETQQPSFYSVSTHSPMQIRNNELYLVSNYSSSSTDFDPSSNVYTPPFAGLNSSTWDIAISRYVIGDLSVDLGEDIFACAESQITLDATTNDATYLWQDNSTSPMFTASNIGSYHVQVLSGGCLAFDTVNVNLGNSLNIISTPDTAICAGSSLQLSVSGGSVYEWLTPQFINNPNIPNPIATPTSTTDFIVFVSDASGECTAQDTITIEVFPDQNLSVSGGGPYCNDEGVMIAVNGAQSVNWSPTTGLNDSTASSTLANPSTETIYSAIYTDQNGCTGEAGSIVVAPGQVPEAGFSLEQINNYEVQFENESIGGTTYFWQFSTFGSSTQENPIFNFPFEGVYSVTLIASNECGNDTISLVVDVLKLNINEINLSEINIFPNPAKGDVLNVLFPNKNISNIQISIFNALGQQLNPQIILESNQILIDISKFTNGVYFLQMSNQNGQTKSKKVIINK